ncbi:TnpV protein [Cytobacillus purgationiresistens]|uniref:TnpV protein n=1 Tax=Cytobacillus purgationiresistens TaxID=863449 RepID=UPI0035215D84
MISYELKEDGNLYPNIQLSNNEQAHQELGKYGKLAMSFLQEKYPIRFQELQMNGTLMDMLHQMDREAKDSIISLMQELEMKNPGPKTEELMEVAQYKNLWSSFIRMKVASTSTFE